MTYNKSVVTTSLLGLMLISSQAISNEGVQFVGSKAATTEITTHQLRGAGGNTNQSQPTTKTVYLQKLILSDEMKAVIADRIAKIESPKMQTTFDRSKKNDSAQVGMNDLEVLDQGVHGTCATFATTAAVDAYIAKDPRNYISQMCNLELGEFLHQQNTQYDSGWEGSFASTILQQMTDYGIISNANCDDKYTSYNTDIGNPLSIEQFNAKHEMIMQSVPYTAIAKNPNSLKADAALTRVKTALKDGHRVLIGTLIVEGADDNGVGLNGMFANTKSAWVLSPVTARGLPSTQSGHEMVITGFDDSAVIPEAKHRGDRGGPKKDGNHPGVLTLRNSWGANTGDQGNYYMSYDYFKAAYMELHEIG